jgi:hypothetical protein
MEEMIMVHQVMEELKHLEELLEDKTQLLVH